MYCKDCYTHRYTQVDEIEDGITIRYWFCEVCGKELYHEVVGIKENERSFSKII